MNYLDALFRYVFTLPLPIGPFPFNVKKLPPNGPGCLVHCSLTTFLSFHFHFSVKLSLIAHHANEHGNTVGFLQIPPKPLYNDVYKELENT